MAAPKQHVELYRKVLLRKALLPWAIEGAVYLPFCGDGDIAVGLYRDRLVYAADLDPKRVEVCRARLPGAKVVVADCDAWPFADQRMQPVAVADFDAYAYPYASFRAFWEQSPKRQRLVLFFTDGERQTIKRNGIWTTPDGEKQARLSLAERRPLYNFYWTRVVEPWFRQIVEGWLVVQMQKYLRRDMLYWGAVIDHND